MEFIGRFESSHIDLNQQKGISIIIIGIENCVKCGQVYRDIAL